MPHTSHTPYVQIVMDASQRLLEQKQQLRAVLPEGIEVRQTLFADYDVEQVKVPPLVIATNLCLSPPAAIAQLERLNNWSPTVPVVALVQSTEDFAEWRKECDNLFEFMLADRFDHREFAVRTAFFVDRQLFRLRRNRDIELFRALMDNVPDRIYFKDVDSRFISVNNRYSSDFKFRHPSDLIGKTDFDLFSVEHAQPAFDDEQAIMHTGKPITGKVEKESFEDGSHAWVTTNKMPLRNSRGEIVGTMGISRVITDLVETQNKLKEAISELRATQQQLVDSEKMKTVGRMAAGIAHEVKNPLSIINMGLDFLVATDATQSPDEYKETVADMKEAVANASDVISELLDYSSPDSQQFEPLCLNDLVSKALRMSSRTLAQSHVVTEEALEPKLPKIDGDASKLHQVLLNLILNACNAMPDGGTLRVRTLMERLTRPRAKASSDLLEIASVGERLVVVEIEDTGTGIPEAVLQKVFEPFYTTNSDSGGTGLGLTVTRHLVSLHHGAIQMTNLPDAGLQVRLIFPLSQNDERNNDPISTHQGSAH